MTSDHDHLLHLAVIVGSTRTGRFAPVVTSWLIPVIEERPDLTLDVLDLAELDLPHVWTRDPSDRVDDYRARLARADAFVIVTPEYNHSYPAPEPHPRLTRRWRLPKESPPEGATG